MNGQEGEATPRHISLERLERELDILLDRAEELLTQYNDIRGALKQMAESDDPKDMPDALDGEADVAAMDGLRSARDTALEARDQLAANKDSQDALRKAREAQSSLEAAIALAESILEV